MREKRLLSAIEEYRQQGFAQNLRPTTMKGRLVILKGLVDFLNKKPLNLENTRAFLTHLRARGWQPSSVNVATKVVRAFVNFLFKRKYISENFSRDLVLAKIPRKYKELIAPEVVEKIIDAGSQPSKIDNQRSKVAKRDGKPALKFMLRTGLRVAELCSLTGSRLQLNDDPPKFIVTSKGGDEEILIVPNDMVEVLRPRVGRDKVFAVTPGGLNRLLKRGAKRLGITTRITCHLLRHIFASERVKSGVPLQVVQRLLRHKSIEVTNQVYSHYDMGDLAAAINSQPIVRVGLTPIQKLEEFKKDVRKLLEKHGLRKDKDFRVVEAQTDKSMAVKAELKS